MEIMFYYRLKGENFLHDMHLDTLLHANRVIKYLKSRHNIEESCVVLIDAKSVHLKTYQGDETLAARAARKADKEGCEKRAMLGKYRSEYMKAMKFHIDAVGPFYPFIPEVYSKVTGQKVYK